MAKELEQERANLEAQQEREGRERERRARRDAERRSDQLKRELQELQAARQESSQLVPSGLSEVYLKPRAYDLRRVHRKTERHVLVYSIRILTVAGARREWVPVEQTQVGSDAPVKMFRKHYHKCLESYQGYVELAERLYQMRDNSQQVPPGLEERE